VKGTTHLYLALILKMCGVIPSLPLRLHGAVLSEAQDKFYLIGLLYVNKVAHPTLQVSLLSCPGARRVYRMESQHPPCGVPCNSCCALGHNKGDTCISQVQTEDYYHVYQKTNVRTTSNSVTPRSVFFRNVPMDPALLLERPNTDELLSTAGK
jgi:hypothetical protein